MIHNKQGKKKKIELAIGLSLIRLPAFTENDTLDNKNSNWDKTGESKRKSVTSGPTLGWYKGAVVFARAMFQKCSVFTSHFQTEDQEGRKHLLPVEEVHFSKTNADLHCRASRPAARPSVYSGREICENRRILHIAS